MADGGEGAGESITVHHLVEQIRIGSTVANEVNTVRAMQRLFSMCRSKTPGHIANQAAAADADAVTALLDLVNSGSIRQRTWAFNTLGRLCFDHAENAAKVCTSPAMEKAVDNMMSMSMSTVGVADERAPGVVGTQATPGLIMWRQPEPVLQPGRLAQLKSDPARVKDKSAYLLGNLAARPASHPRLLACGAANAAVAVLTALNYAREKAKDQNDPAPLPIHDAFIARCVGLLTNLSVHEPSRAAVLQAGAILPLIQVAQSGCARHRPASAAIASANLCKRGSGTRFDRQSVPDLDAFPTDVLGNVVEALSSAVKREKYMGNVYYTPWKVAMGVSNLAALCSENRCALIQHGVVRHLVVGLDFDERSQHHCTSALYEICVGYPKMEAEVLMKESETVRHRVMSPLIAAEQRSAWGRIASLRAPVGSPINLLSGDLVEMVGCWVSAQSLSYPVLHTFMAARCRDAMRAAGLHANPDGKHHVDSDSDDYGSESDRVGAD